MSLLEFLQKKKLMFLVFYRFPLLPDQVAKGKEKKSNGFAYISFDDMKMEEREPNICLDSLGASVAQLNLVLLVENFWGRYNFLNY